MQRNAIAIVLAIVAAIVIYQFAWIPIVADRAVTRLSVSTNAAYNLPPYRAASLARANENEARRLFEKSPDNISLAMLAAANAELLGDNETARALYRDALRRERRPELLINLGLLEARTGDRAHALEHLGDAVTFDPKSMRQVNDPQLLVALNAIVEKRYASKSNLLQNADFSRAALGGPASSWTTTADSTVNGAAAAAANWSVYNNSPSTTTTTIVPSTRRPGAKMMRVTTGGEYNGLLQVWGDPDVGPPSVRASIWVFIRRGAVFLGTGNASAGPDTQTNVIGQWVQLTALNSTCPANQTAIFAVGKEGADYDVDSPVVIVNPGGFCAPP